MDKPTLGVYVHWPFCAAKCPYCDFNSHVRQAVDHSAWRKALLTELATMAARLPDRRVVSIFFGGGTPSLMAPETVAAIITDIGHHWDLDPAAEITLEANPSSVEAGRFAEFRAAGVGRVSLGVQALRDADLKALGRLHSAADAKRAFDTAQKTFPRVSFDLIYARQRQSLADWEKELREALDMTADHLSLYQLTVEPGTRFGALHARGRLRGLPSPALSATFYEVTQALTEAAGLPAYEVSNHAKPGCESRHNLVYWMARDFIGIGPGAHGRFGTAPRIGTETELMPEVWLERVGKHGHGIVSEEMNTGFDHAAEYLMMGLRLRRGISLRRLSTLGISDLDTGFFEDEGLLHRAGDTLRATARGNLLLNTLVAELLPRESAA
ncbi:MAG: radical SAM family heme chaperone HemW [Pseudomonadota bacterium]